MRKALVFTGAAVLILGTAVTSTASAQEAPVCGPPGEEQPATIVGAGTIVGTSGDDVIVGSDGVDTINGGSGNDVICGEGGNDVIDGGSGVDVLIGDNADLPPFLPSNGTNNDHLIGGSGADHLFGVGGNDVLEGGSGDDELIGFGGNDTISGGTGADTAFGGPLNDVIDGGSGDDTLWGNFGSDTITGGSGADFIDGDNPFPDPPPFTPARTTTIAAAAAAPTRSSTARSPSSSTHRLAATESACSTNATSPSRRRRASRESAHGLHVLLDDRERLLQLVGGAELDDLGARVQDRRVARADVVGVAGLERLLAVGGLERDLALDDVAPVRALAAVVGQADEQRRQVGVGGVGLEADGVAAVEVLEVALVALDLHGFGRAGLGCTRHRNLPCCCLALICVSVWVPVPSRAVDQFAVHRFGTTDGLAVSASGWMAGSLRRRPDR